MNNRMRVVPATENCLRAYYGVLPPVPVCALAFVDEAGETKGIVGLASRAGEHVLFADASDEVRKLPLLVMKATRRVLALAGGAPVIAMAENTIEASERFLERLGFTPTGRCTEDGRVYRCSG